MCSIFGWMGRGHSEAKIRMIERGNIRGRDGFGFWIDGQTYRSKTYESPTDNMKRAIITAKVGIGTFRATPTTEAETTIKNLQPYGGIVHNGTVANCDNFGKFEIDSMALPVIFKGCRTDHDYAKAARKIKGGYAIALSKNRLDPNMPDGLFIVANYKPVYYTYFKEAKFKNFVAFASTPEQLEPFQMFAPITKLPPYHYMTIGQTGFITKKKLLTNKFRGRVLVSASAGLDSTTVAYILQNKGYEVELVHFTYGCKAEGQEIERIKAIAGHGKFPLHFIELPKIMSGTIVSDTYNKDQKYGVRYAADWVSARNLLMLSCMTAFAETAGFDAISFGGNLEEGGAFPDNEPEFGRMFNQLLPYAVKENYQLQLINPIANLMKHEIVREGIINAVPYELTWSCYGDGDVHCGECSPCYMRKMAFERNGRQDPVFSISKIKNDETL